MQKLTVKKDLGQKETYDKWNGKFLDETAYDEVIKVTDTDMGVMKPIMSLDGSDVPLAYVITNAFPKESKIRDILTTIEDTSTMRANCSGPIDKEEMLAKGLVEGQDYKLRTPNSYYVRTKSGGWGMIAAAVLLILGNFLLYILGKKLSDLKFTLFFTAIFVVSILMATLITVSRVN